MEIVDARKITEFSDETISALLDHAVKESVKIMVK
jgi:hypothetical protein